MRNHQVVTDGQLDKLIVAVQQSIGEVQAIKADIQALKTRTESTHREHMAGLESIHRHVDDSTTAGKSNYYHGARHDSGRYDLGPTFRGLQYELGRRNEGRSSQYVCYSVPSSPVLMSIIQR